MVGTFDLLSTFLPLSRETDRPRIELPDRKGQTWQVTG